MARNDLITPNFSTAIQCPRLGYNKTDKKNGQKLCCLFCRYKRLQYIQQFPDCTTEYLDAFCPLYDTKHFFKKCSTCNKSTDNFFLYGIDEIEFLNQSIMILSIYRRFFPYFIDYRKKEKIADLDKNANTRKRKEILSLALEKSVQETIDTTMKIKPKQPAAAAKIRK